MTAGAIGQQALVALADARSLEATVQGLRSRSLALLQRLDRAATEADWAAKQALQRIDELAQTAPSELGAARPSDDTWQAITRATQQTCDLEADAARLLDRQNGATP